MTTEKKTATEIYQECKPKATCPETCEDCEIFNAMMMEGDALEARSQDVAFMRHWERKGEGW